MIPNFCNRAYPRLCRDAEGVTSTIGGVSPFKTLATIRTVIARSMFHYLVFSEVFQSEERQLGLKILQFTNPEFAAFSPETPLPSPLHYREVAQDVPIDLTHHLW